MHRLKITLVWTQTRKDHIRRHGVEPHEVDEVVSGDVLLRRYHRH